jgi:hypothetical protein
MSKGSRQRPSQVPQAQVDANWDAIFGKKIKTSVVTAVYNDDRQVSKEKKTNASKSKRK